jgi:adenylate cyclase
MRSREWRGRIVQHAAAIASLPSDSPDERLRKSTLVLTSILITVFSCIWVGTYAALGLWLAALVPLGYQVASLVGLALLARTKRYSVYRASQIALMLLLPFLLQWTLGGFVESGSVAIWAFFAPLAALVFYGPREAIPWFGAFLALVVLSAAIDGVLPEPSHNIPSWVVVAFFALNIFGPSITTFALLEHFVRSRDRAHRLLSAEQERSETLLLSIFPRAIAERLKVSRAVIAERSEEVSVLFADLIGFTPIAERLPAEEVVVLLDEIFSGFDELVAR